MDIYFTIFSRNFLSVWSLIHSVTEKLRISFTLLFRIFPKVSASNNSNSKFSAKNINQITFFCFDFRSVTETLIRSFIQNSQINIFLQENSLKKLHANFLSVHLFRFFHVILNKFSVKKGKINTYILFARIFLLKNNL